MKRFLAILCTVAMLFSLPIVLPLSTGAAGEQGFLFSENDVLMAGGSVKTPPKTISMWLKIPAGLTSRAYTPLSNFVDESHEALSVEIHENGRPRVYIRRNVNGYDGDSTIKSVREECKWSINLADGAWHHVEFVIGEGLANILCYVDGTLIADKTLNKADKKVTTALAANPNPMRLGQGWKPGVTTEYFRGAMGSIACYSDLRTAAEVSADYNAGKSTYRKAAADYADAGLLYAYDMMSSRFTDDLSANGNHIALPVKATSGMAFTGKEDVVMAKAFTERAPYTFEAEIFAPSGVATRAGVIMGNFMDDAACSMNIEIAAGGHPRVYFVHSKTDSSGNVTNTDITFDEVDVRTGDWAHLAIVFDDANDKLHCYLNGELKQTRTCTESYYEGTFDWPFLIGSDYRAGNAQYFKGNIRGVAVYADVRTAAEIKADFAATTLATTDEACLGAWVLDDAASHGKLYRDLGPAQNDVTYTNYWFDKTEAEEASDFAYSFAIVGDTQGINDTGNGAKMAQLYDWIVANKESKNIQYVVGVGDITEHISLGHASHTREWEIAVESIGKLDAAGIPHIQVRGNHDHPISFNKYFGAGTAYGDTLEGTYNDTAANSYKRFTIGNTKWLFLTLDHGAAFGAIEWAAEVIDRYSDHKVIVATHGYMYGNGDYHTDRYDYSPAYQTLDKNGNKVVGGFNGDELWAKLISQHENITLMLCGHNYGNVIPVRQDMGVHGNIVTQVLVDFQYIDQKEEDAGIVTMFYFSADGSTVEVETYSTLKNKYYRAANQFTMSLTGEENPGRENDGYGWLEEGKDYCFEIVYPANKVAATDKIFGVRYKTLSEVNAAIKDGAVVKMLGNVKSNHKTTFAWTTAKSFTIDGGGWIYDAHGWDTANTYVWSFSQTNAVVIRHLTMVSGVGCISVKNTDLALRSGARLYGGWSYGYKNENYYVADFGTNGSFAVPGAEGTDFNAQTTLYAAGGGSAVIIEKGAAIYAGGGVALSCDGTSAVTVNGGYFESHRMNLGTVATLHSSKSDKALTVNGGTFANYYFDADGNMGHALENGSGNVTVNGGTFIAYGAPLLSCKNASSTEGDPNTVINGGMFISETAMEDGVPVILGEKANALVVVDDATGRSKVTVSGGVFLNKRAQTTALYSAGGNTVTLSGGRFLSLSTASDNLSLTAQQKAATLKLWGGRYYVISELLGAVDEKAPILLDGAQVNLSVKNAGIRFVSTVKKISGATYGTIIVPTEDVIEAMALAGGITEENLIKVSAHGEIAKIQASKKNREENDDGTLTFYAALTGLSGRENVSFTAVSYTVLKGVTYYSQPKLLDNSRTISAVAAAALADVALEKGGQNSYEHICDVPYLFNDAGVVVYHRYDNLRQQILVSLMTEEDLAACKAAVIAKHNAR